MSRASFNIVTGGGLLCLTACLAAAAAGPPGSADKIKVDGDRPVFPESITSTPDGTIYTSSLGLGVVFKAAPGAKEAVAWSEKQPEGPRSILGVLADPTTKTLWACYSDWALSSGNSGKPAILRALSLDSGKVKQSYPMPEKSFCNDITITSDGTIYATETHGGKIMRLRNGASKLESWFEDGRLKGVDGITPESDGSLIVNNVNTNKLFRLTIKSDRGPDTLTELSLSTPVNGPDGMRPGKNGRIYLAENAAGQVDVLQIQGNNVAVKPVAQGYQAPTSMTQQGDKLYITEAKIHQYGDQPNEPRNPSPFYIYPVPIPAS